jgi:hypothetical protein
MRAMKLPPHCPSAASSAFRESSGSAPPGNAPEFFAATGSGVVLE